MTLQGRLLVEDRVRDEWIDINDHMNVAYYVLAFDLAIDALWKEFGIDERYVATRRFSTFAVESHIEYKREMPRGAPYRVTTEILAYDDKRIHQFMRMYHADEDYLAATSEWMNLHVDLSVRRVRPWPDDVLARIAGVASAQDNGDWPEAAGRRMHISNPVYRLDNKLTEKV